MYSINIKPDQYQTRDANANFMRPHSLAMRISFGRKKKTEKKNESNRESVNKSRELKEEKIYASDSSEFKF